VGDPTLSGSSVGHLCIWDNTTHGLCMVSESLIITRLFPFNFIKFLIRHEWSLDLQRWLARGTPRGNYRHISYIYMGQSEIAKITPQASLPFPPLESINPICPRVILAVSSVILITSLGTTTVFPGIVVTSAGQLWQRGQLG